MYVGVGALPTTVPSGKQLKQELAAQLRSKMTEAERRDTLQRAASLLPQCYSEEMDRCLNGENEANFRNCSEILLGYIADWDRMEATVDPMPYCSKNQIMSPMGYGVIGASVLAGIMIGFALKAKKG